MSLVSRLNGLAKLASQRSDVVVAVFMMLAVVMIVVPLPTAVVDVLIAFNMALSLLTLIVAFYVSSPVEFSALPPIILLGTLFRLALSITTTRLILLQGDAGHIVASFGNFVIGGEVVVGLVVFLIITVAQFIVITKGAERVAEVAARFTLDAMPGKQMAIDNDLRSGDIKQDEARTRRHRLERESQLYGAMDGAMKFVKGDAIAGLVIVFVNLVGGLMIGMLRHGMSFAEASHTYSLLTVGDGLIAQIPALLIAIGAGTIVTRVASDVEGDLGSEIIRQLGASDRALALAAAILFAAGFIPGFPMLVFFALAAGLGGAAYLLYRRRQGVASSEIALAEGSSGSSSGVIEAQDALPHAQDGNGRIWSSGPNTRHRVSAFLGGEVMARIAPARFREEADRVRLLIQNDLGIEIPAVEMRPDPLGAPTRFRIDFENVPVLDGTIPSGKLLLSDDPAHAELLDLEAQLGPDLPNHPRSAWVDVSDVAAMQEAGIGYREPDTIIAELLGDVLKRYAAHFVGIQETRELLNGMESDHAELVKEVVRVVPLQRLCEVIRHLIEEGVPVRNFRTVLEAAADWGQRESDPLVLTERIRTALARQISFRHAQIGNVVSACILSRATEDAVREAMRTARAGGPLALGDDMARSLLTQFRRIAAEAETKPAVVVSADIRRAVRGFLGRGDVELSVLSFSEIAPEFSIQSVASVSLPNVATRRLRGLTPPRIAETSPPPLHETA